MAELIKKENIVNGTVLGAAVGVAFLYGDKVREPLLDFINNNLPDSLSFLGSLAIPIIVIGGLALVGYIVDKY